LSVLLLKSQMDYIGVDCLRGNKKSPVEIRQFRNTYDHNISYLKIYLNILYHV
jgi:hypothetical protein